MRNVMPRLQSKPFWSGLLLGGAVVFILGEAPYVNWASIAPPVDKRPLVIRQDAKGDGRFASPRSGHRRHRGIDLAAPLHSPVRAIRSGRVVQVGTHRGLGRFVELEHQRGLHSLYAHMDTVVVTAGQRLRQGAQVGTVGKTGNARHRWITPHLHLEIVRDGQPVDPAALGLQVDMPRSVIAEEEGNADGRGGE